MQDQELKDVHKQVEKREAIGNFKQIRSSFLKFFCSDKNDIKTVLTCIFMPHFHALD